MRADNEHMLCNSTESHKDNAKPHQCPKTDQEGTELEMAKNGTENTCLLCESRGAKLDKEKDRKMMEHGASEYMTTVLNGGGKEVQESHFSGKRESLENGVVFYLDKSVTACELPEIVVCYKKSTHNVVKDICIDEGVPVQEKILFDEKDNGKCILNQRGPEDSMDIMKVKNEVEELSDNHKAEDIQKFSAKVCANTGDSGKYDQENLNVTEEVTDDSKSNIIKDLPVNVSGLSVGIDSDKDISTHHGSENLLLREEEVKTRITVSKESLTLGDILSMEDGKKPFSNSGDDPREQSSQKQSGNKSLESETLIPVVEDLNESDAVSQEIPSPERVDDSADKGNSNSFKNTEMLDLSTASASQESMRTASQTKALCDNSETSLQFNDPQKPNAERRMPRFNYMFENYDDDHPFPSHFPSGFGESSFSAAEPVSGHITYSGPIAFSGSLSVRSDGSTTSTRSFAFPILQSEWNSSPIRMAKAERRHHRSQKRWTQTLLCCRF